LSDSRRNWELTILDPLPFVKTDLGGGLGVGDVDGDGNLEIVASGTAGFEWLRPATGERGLIAGDRVYQVGVAMEDVDGDGLPEAIDGDCDPPTSIFWFKPGPDIHQPWQRHAIDPAVTGSPHDLIFADVDGDGENELIANAIDDGPGLYLYKRTADPMAPWRKHCVQSGLFTEGLAAGDLDGDGRLEIVAGPDWYKAPPEGPFAGPWQRRVLAPGFREMCRVATVDVTGNGRPDVIIVESEFPDGRLSWFENRLREDPAASWREHELAQDLNFGHSLQAWRDAASGKAFFFLAEMARGGYGAPPNHDARLLQFSTADGGGTWQRELIYRGAGTHQALVFEMDGQGARAIAGKECFHPQVQLWRRLEEPSPLSRFRHHLLDRDKPHTATDILAVDVTGDGRADVVCGRWWYRNPTWERYEIPGIYQAINAYDLDGDGRLELVATLRNPQAKHWYEGLTSDLVWLKPVDPLQGLWQQYAIGRGHGDWLHGSLVAPILPGGGLALIIGYHDADEVPGHGPELFAVPADPRQGPWPVRLLADLPYGEEFAAADIDGDGRLDIVAGSWWLENRGDGTFAPYRFVDGFKVARLRVVDVNGNGRPDVVLGEEDLDFEKRISPFSRVAWFENPPDPRQGPWSAHIVDSVRCPHSIDAADLDGDGEIEIVCGEHDPFNPYRSRSRLLVYKRTEPTGCGAWVRHVVDARFEHHDGARVIELAPGRFGILSHGWTDSRYVHLWELE